MGKPRGGGGGGGGGGVFLGVGLMGGGAVEVGDHRWNPRSRSVFRNGSPPFVRPPLLRCTPPGAAEERAHRAETSKALQPQGLKGKGCPPPHSLAHRHTHTHRIALLVRLGVKL